MRYACLADADYRFEDHGPAYLIRGPRTDIGVVHLRPGDDVSNHKHETVEESFFIIAGTGSLWINCSEQHQLSPGDIYQSPPGETHYFVNDGTVPLRLLFAKAPYAPADTIQVPWLPGSPTPLL